MIDDDTLKQLLRINGVIDVHFSRAQSTTFGL